MEMTDFERNVLRALCNIGQAHSILEHFEGADEELAAVRRALGDLAAAVARTYAGQLRTELMSRETE